MGIKQDLKPNESKMVKMTFEEYTKSPFPKKASAMTGEMREMILSNYKRKLDAVIVREMNKFDYTLYYNKEKDIYICHLKVPSEVVPKLRYDVVIKFFTDDPILKNRNTLDKYYVQFFSNDPAYNFTFCNTHIEYGLYFTDLHSKSCKKVIKEKADIRNPKDELGYVKSLVFAYFIMKSKSLFNKIMYETHGNKYNVNTLLGNIMSSDDKIAQRTELGQEIARQASRAKKGINAGIKDRLNDREYSNKADRIRSHNNKTKKTKTVGVVKTIKTTKKR